MSIKILDYTKEPLKIMSECASICYDSIPKDVIAKHCIESGHTRVSEFADVTVEISEYSARVMRELYTHIQGTSRLQRSTRYVNEDGFGYYTPPSIIEHGDEAVKRYQSMMVAINTTYNVLVEMGIPKEDVANLLPLGGHSKMVLKINVRALIHLAETRLCKRAYIEFRELMSELLPLISELDSDWEFIINNYCKKKCEKGKCTEKIKCK